MELQQNIYSIRMRASEGGAHEEGGRHISGAEYLSIGDTLENLVGSLVSRARFHSKGKPDFINIVIEQVKEEKIKHVPLLKVHTVKSLNYEDGRAKAEKLLEKIGVSPIAIRRAMNLLTSLSNSMRGAMLINSQTGERMDNLGNRGIRVSRMDLRPENLPLFLQELELRKLNNTHVRDALILASKVANARGVVAELCWSDDPDYPAGYVASKEMGYYRFTSLKPLGSQIGGRVFFTRPDTDVEDLQNFLETKPVFVNTSKEWMLDYDEDIQGRTFRIKK